MCKWVTKVHRFVIKNHKKYNSPTLIVWHLLPFSQVLLSVLRSTCESLPVIELCLHSASETSSMTNGNSSSTYHSAVHWLLTQLRTLIACQRTTLSSSSSIRYVTGPWVLAITPGNQLFFSLKSFTYIVHVSPALNWCYLQWISWCCFCFIWLCITWSTFLVLTIRTENVWTFIIFSKLNDFSIENVQ